MSRLAESAPAPLEATVAPRSLRGLAATAREPRVLAALALAFASALGSGDAWAEEPSIDQVQYDPAALPPDGARSRLIWTGAGLAVGWYGVGVGTSLLWGDAPSASELRLPVVGPWMALGEVRCGREETRCTTGTLVLRTVLAVLSGVGQIGGLAAVAEGIFLDTGSSAPPTPSATQSSWMAVPVVASDGFGLELVGHF